MKTLLTGANGFVGKHLQSILPVEPLIDSNGKSIDLRNYHELEYFCKKMRPEAVIHLAAQSFVPRSFEDPLETYQINFIGTLNLLNSLKAANFKGKFLYVGSGDVYGHVLESDLPIHENLPLKPRNPYAVSKAAAEALCFQWSQSEIFEIILARPFNQIGAGQSEHFAISNFAKQLIEIKGGLKESQVEVGDLDVTRDFTDVRDAIRAYELLLNYGKNAEVYNICSNKETSLREIMNKMISLLDISCDLRIKNVQERQRRSEQKRVWGSSNKIYLETKWEPQISLEKTLTDILNYWEKALLCVEKL